MISLAERLNLSPRHIVRIGSVTLEYQVMRRCLFRPTYYGCTRVYTLGQCLYTQVLLNPATENLFKNHYKSKNGNDTWYIYFWGFMEAMSVQDEGEDVWVNIYRLKFSSDGKILQDPTGAYTSNFIDELYAYMQSTSDSFSCRQRGAHYLEEGRKRLQPQA